ALANEKCQRSALFRTKPIRGAKALPGSELPALGDGMTTVAGAPGAGAARLIEGRPAGLAFLRAVIEDRLFALRLVPQPSQALLASKHREHVENAGRGDAAGRRGAQRLGDDAELGALFDRVVA